MTTHRRQIFTTDARFDAQPATEDGKPAKLVGYAMVWNAVSGDRGGYKVRLLKGSANFTTVTHALFHHDYRYPLGDTGSNSLLITPDDIGVRVEITLPDTTYARDIFNLVRDKRVRGMSFAMVDTPAGETVDESGQKILNVKSFECDEVTVTPIPAFTETDISIKPLSDFSHRRKHQAELDRFTLNRFRPVASASRLAG